MSARALLKMGARALLNNECSSPQNNGCACPHKIMGARPHFSREYFMNLFFWDSFYIHMCSFICSLIECSLNGECSCPSKKMGARAPKIMGARAPKNNGCAPSFFQESISWTYFFHVHFAFAQLFSVWLFFKQWVLVPLWVMGARALLENGCSSPQNNGCSTSTPKIMGARPHFSGERFVRLFLSQFFFNHSCSCCCFLISCASYFHPCTYLIVLSIAY